MKKPVLRFLIADLIRAQQALNELEEVGVLSDDQTRDYLSEFLYSKGLDYEQYLAIIWVYVCYFVIVLWSVLSVQIIPCAFTMMN